jgi:hypothetical protein
MAGTFQVGQRAARSLPERWPAVLPWVSFLSGGEEHYDVLADGTVVGRIMMFADMPAGKPWMWSLAYGQHEDRAPTHGYEPTREAAMQALAKSWNRDWSTLGFVARGCRFEEGCVPFIVFEFQQLLAYRGLGRSLSATRAHNNVVDSRRITARVFQLWSARR